jgi:hypothetical protein
MGVGTVFLNAQVYAGAADMTGYTNKITVDTTIETLDNTAFDTNGWQTFAAGKKTASLQQEGFIDWPYPYDAPNYGDVEYWTIATGTEPDGLFAPNAWGGSLRTTSLSQEIMHAALGTMSTSAQGTGPDWGVTGGLSVPRETFPDSSAEDGLLVEVPSLVDGERVAMLSHCFSAGTTMILGLESDDNTGFTSGTVRAGDSITTEGSSLVTFTASSTTDQYWRVNVLTSGIFDVAVSILRFT